MEASTSRQCEPRVDTEESTSGPRQEEENEEVHQDEPHQLLSPPRQEKDNVNNEEGQQEERDDEEDAPPRPKQNSHEFEKEFHETIPLNKSSMIFKPGESLALKLVWLIFVKIIHSSSIEPMKVEEALEDPDWINAMHEELHNFERNQV